MVENRIEFPFDWWYYGLVWTNRNARNAIWSMINYWKFWSKFWSFSKNTAYSKGQEHVKNIFSLQTGKSYIEDYDHFEIELNFLQEGCSLKEGHWRHVYITINERISTVNILIFRTFKSTLNES